MSAKWHDASVLEMIIVGVILLSGLAIAWINNPYAYDVLPLDKMDNKKKYSHWIIWAMTYAPIFIYLQIGSGNLIWKVLLAVVFLIGAILTKLESKELGDLEKED